MLHTVTSTRANFTILPTIWLVGALAFFITEALAAAAVPPPYIYSYARDYISQLGVPGWTRLAAVMNAGFCAQGVLFLVGALLAARTSATGRRRLFVVLVALYALGDVLVAAFHGDPATAASGAGGLHWLGALLAILAGNAAILAGSSVVAGLVNMRWYRRVSVFLAVLGFLSFVILGNPAARSHLGVWERGCVYSTLLWQILSALVLLLARRKANIPRPVTS
jgi:Protein of unknown function (DUF998)